MHILVVQSLVKHSEVSFRVTRKNYWRFLHQNRGSLLFQPVNVFLWTSAIWTVLGPSVVKLPSWFWAMKGIVWNEMIICGLWETTKHLLGTVSLNCFFKIVFPQVLHIPNLFEERGSVSLFTRVFFISTVVELDDLGFILLIDIESLSNSFWNPDWLIFNHIVKFVECFKTSQLQLIKHFIHGQHALFKINIVISENGKSTDCGSKHGTNSHSNSAHLRPATSTQYW